MTLPPFGGLSGGPVDDGGVWASLAWIHIALPLQPETLRLRVDCISPAASIPARQSAPAVTASRQPESQVKRTQSSYRPRCTRYRGHDVLDPVDSDIVFRHQMRRGDVYAPLLSG
jgi:hypothetical protein